jgi:hypothetical protein
MDSKLRIKRCRGFAAAAVAMTSALIAAAPGAAHAVGFGNRQWTTIGSAGVEMRGRATDAGTAAVLGTDSTSATLRYNVVAVDGLFETNGPGATSSVMAARFLDPGANSQVIVRLKKTDLLTSATTTLLTIDSNSFAASNVYQNQTRGCGEGFDFARYAYYVEVTLSRTVLNTSAGIASIQVGKAAQCIGAASN